MSYCIQRFISFILLVLPFSSQAQKNSEFQALRIGDTVPNYPFNNLVNYPATKAKISDFKGKLLILDYWFTGCKPCIASWPKLQKLQKKFEKDIRIVLVNHMEGEALVRSFIERRNKMVDLDFTLPSATGDTVLHKILPPKGYPTIVWIDRDGVYRGSSAGEELNEENVRTYLRGGKTITRTTELQKISFDPGQPIFAKESKYNSEQILWCSTLSKYSDSLPGGITLIKSDSLGYYITMTNQSIMELIRYAYGQEAYLGGIYTSRLPFSRLELKVQDKSRFGNSIQGKHQFQNLFTYQLISGEPKTKDQLKEIMRDDLKDYFNLSFEWKKVTKRCFVLMATDTTIISEFKDAKPAVQSYKDGTKGLRNMRVEDFLNYLRNFHDIYFYSSHPIVDETGFKGGLDIKFGPNSKPENFYNDFKALDKALSKYKMRFKLEDREIEVLMITDFKMKKD